VFKWDGSPQPVALWRTDADLAKAFKGDIGWWFQHLATQIGHDRYASALRDLDYGDKNASGPPNNFWMGPDVGGGLSVTETQQARFIRRFYAGDLPVKPDALALVQGLTQEEVRADPKGGQAVLSGRTASCAATADDSQSVGWWVGRLKSPKHDLSFSASIEGVNAPPGLEIQRRLTNIFTDAQLLPPASS
jgi:beta-lactamase class D